MITRNLVSPFFRSFYLIQNDLKVLVPNSICILVAISRSEMIPSTEDVTEKWYIDWL